MDKLQAYSWLFADSMMTSLILPPHVATVFGAMKGFGGYNILWMLCGAILGSILGSSLNYGLGRLILTCINKEKYSQKMDINKVSYYFTRYGLWLLLFPFVPAYGSFLTVVAGLLRIRFIWFFALITLGYSCFFSWQLFY